MSIEVTRVGQYRVYTRFTESFGVKPQTRNRRFSLLVLHALFGSKVIHHLTRRQVGIAHDGAVLALELTESMPGKRMSHEEDARYGRA